MMTDEELTEDEQELVELVWAYARVDRRDDFDRVDSATAAILAHYRKAKAGPVEVNTYEAAARIVRATVGRELTAEESERLQALVKDHNIRASWG